MRWVLIVCGSVVGLVALILAYAYFNLNSIVAANRNLILARASDALGRPVEVGKIHAGLSHGVEIDLQNVTVADDQAFSANPFLQVRELHARVEFIPLLMRSVRVTSFLIESPQVTFIRNRAGQLNISTIAKRSGVGQTPQVKPSPPRLGLRGSAEPPMQLPNAGGGGSAADLNAISVRKFKITDGAVLYRNEAVVGPPIQVTGVNLAVADFQAEAPFIINATLSALGADNDLAVAGKVGPLLREGKFDLDLFPVDLKAKLGPVLLTQIETLTQVAPLAATGITVGNPMQINARINGTAQRLQFVATSDLSSNHLVYPGMIDKPAGLATKVSVEGSGSGAHINLSNVDLTIGDLLTKATNVVFKDDRIAAQLDVDHCDLASLTEVVTVAQPYNPSGETTFHGKVAIIRHKPSLNGDLTLSKVGATIPGGKFPPISKLSGVINVAGNSAKIGPLNVDLGSSHAVLEAQAESLQPLHVSYKVSADTLNVRELIPSRAQTGEQMKQFSAIGNLSRDGDRLSLNTDAASVSGTIANVAYQNLATTAAYAGERLTINSMRFNAFNGAVRGSGQATVGKTPTFELAMNADKIDLQQALASQKAKAAETISGTLTGAVQLAGNGANFDAIRPTLRGSGNALLNDGRLKGVNVVAEALKKVDNLPGIGVLVPSTVVSKHPELFKSPDTAIDRASLTFTITGPRLTSHDINASTADYTILGDGWFDMDKNLDLAARILLSRPFSAELVQARSPVAYLENQNRQVDIPLQISGRLPKAQVLPNVTDMTQRVGSHALGNALDKLLKGKGGGSGGNPLNELKGLFR